MLKIFERWARVKEMFISRRLNRWGRRFDFVKFFKVENEVRLEKQLDQIYIGNIKLYVNIHRYRRGGDVQLGGASNATRMARKQYIHKPVKQRVRRFREKRKERMFEGSLRETILR